MTSGRRFELKNDDHSEDESDESGSSQAASLTAETSASTTTTTGVSTNCHNTEEVANSIAEKEHLKKFVFTNIVKKNSESGSSSSVNVKSIERITHPNGDIIEKLEINIPELLQGAYSFYTWPCAFPVLSWFLWEKRNFLFGKRILELGSGCSLPGILAAKCGARVILSEHCILPKSLAHIHKACLANDLVPSEDIHIIGVSWGLLLNSLFNLGPLDLIIAADCFYDPSVFEDIIVTVSFLLERNPAAKFIFTYQERSADWSIEALLKKWKLSALPVNIDDLGKQSGVDITDLLGGHTIHLIEITKDGS